MQVWWVCVALLSVAHAQDVAEFDYVTNDVICSDFSLGAAGELVEDEREVILTTDDMFYDASESDAHVESK